MAACATLPRLKASDVAQARLTARSAGLNVPMIEVNEGITMEVSFKKLFFQEIRGGFGFALSTAHAQLGRALERLPCKQ